MFARVQAKRAESVAAVGIRDHVPRYQKVGTRLFTRSFLEATYGEYAYVVEGSRSDRRAAKAQFMGSLKNALARREARNGLATCGEGPGRSFTATHR